VNPAHLVPGRVARIRDGEVHVVMHAKLEEPAIWGVAGVLPTVGMQVLVAVRVPGSSPWIIAVDGA